jgi:hypothetical protein
LVLFVSRQKERKVYRKNERLVIKQMPDLKPFTKMSSSMRIYGPRPGRKIRGDATKGAR